jgi:hypothetical protein
MRPSGASSKAPRWRTARSRRSSCAPCSRVHVTTTRGDFWDLLATPRVNARKSSTMHCRKSCARQRKRNSRHSPPPKARLGSGACTLCRRPATFSGGPLRRVRRTQSVLQCGIFSLLVIRIIFNVLINFTMGLIGALVAFIWYLWDVIRAYQPDPVTAVVSFCVFAVVATSMVATYLLLLYGTVASTGYMMVRAVANSARIEGGASNATRGHLGDGGAGHSTASSQPNSSERTSGFADAPSQSSAEDLATDFPIGRRVKVIGLASRPELNGQTGRVKSLNEVTVPCSQSKQYS